MFHFFFFTQWVRNCDLPLVYPPRLDFLKYFDAFSDTDNYLKYIFSWLFEIMHRLWKKISGCLLTNFRFSPEFRNIIFICSFSPIVCFVMGLKKKFSTFLEWKKLLLTMCKGLLFVVLENCIYGLKLCVFFIPIIVNEISNLLQEWWFRKKYF